jgi:FKBP-type peptidyl-prolyl cis-trans isomerase
MSALAMVSKSAEYYKTHPAARARKKAYDTKFESSPTQKAKRRELARKNAEHDRKFGAASRQGKDLSHTKSGLRYKPTSQNRGSKTDMPGDRRARGSKH